MHDVVSVERTSTSNPAVDPARDRESERWVAQLRAGHPRRERTVQRLHELLRRAAFHELSRRRALLGRSTGPSSMISPSRRPTTR
jgi:hypothetical protein